MTQKSFALDSAVRSARFTVREDYTLAVTMGLECGERTLVFHDCIRRAGHRYFLFHPKTELAQKGNTVIVRTSAIDPEDLNAPIPGLLVTYRFTFDADTAAFYLSASYGSDVRVCDCNVKLMDVSWEDMDPRSFTGYEYDAQGNEIKHAYSESTMKEEFVV